jgi:hypothetical protein
MIMNITIYDIQAILIVRVNLFILRMMYDLRSRVSVLSAQLIKESN